MMACRVGTKGRLFPQDLPNAALQCDRVTVCSDPVPPSSSSCRLAASKRCFIARAISVRIQGLESIRAIPRFRIALQSAHQASAWASAVPRYAALPVTSMTYRVVAMLASQMQTRRPTLATSTVRHRPAHRYRYVDPADGSGGGKGFVGGGSGDGSGTGVSGGIGFGSGSGGCDTGVIDVMRAGSAPRELCRAGPGSRPVSLG